MTPLFTDADFLWARAKEAERGKPLFTEEDMAWAGKDKTTLRKVREALGLFTGEEPLDVVSRETVRHDEAAPPSTTHVPITSVAEGPPVRGAPEGMTIEMTAEQRAATPPPPEGEITAGHKPEATLLQLIKWGEDDAIIERVNRALLDPARRTALELMSGFADPTIHVLTDPMGRTGFRPFSPKENRDAYKFLWKGEEPSVKEQLTYGIGFLAGVAIPAGALGKIVSTVGKAIPAMDLARILGKFPAHVLGKIIHWGAVDALYSWLSAGTKMTPSQAFEQALIMGATGGAAEGIAPTFRYLRGREPLPEKIKTKWEALSPADHAAYLKGRKGSPALYEYRIWEASQGETGAASAEVARYQRGGAERALELRKEYGARAREAREAVPPVAKGGFADLTAAEREIAHDVGRRESIGLDLTLEREAGRLGIGLPPPPVRRLAPGESVAGPTKGIGSRRSFTMSEPESPQQIIGRLKNDVDVMTADLADLNAKAVVARETAAPLGAAEEARALKLQQVLDDTEAWIEAQGLDRKAIGPIGQNLDRMRAEINALSQRSTFLKTLRGQEEAAAAGAAEVKLAGKKAELAEWKKRVAAVAKGKGGELPMAEMSAAAILGTGATVSGDETTDTEMRLLMAATLIPMAFTTRGRGMLRGVVRGATPQFVKQARKLGESKAWNAFMDEIQLRADPIRAKLSGTAIDDLERLGMGKYTKKEKIALGKALAGNGTHRDTEAYRKLLTRWYEEAVDRGIPVKPFRKPYFPYMLNHKAREALWDEAATLERKIEGMGEAEWIVSKEGREVVDALVNVERGTPLLDPSKVPSAATAKEAAGLRGLLRTKPTIGRKTMRALDHMIATKQAETYADAYRMLKGYVRDELYRPFVNLERSRKLSLPEDFYEWDASIVLTRYAKEWGRRLGEAEVFGVKGEDVEKAFAKIRREAPGEEKFARDVYSTWSGRLETDHRLSRKARMAIEAGTTFELVTKIGGGFGTLLNTTQTLISTMPLAGIRNTFVGTLKVLDPKRRREIRRSGATLATAIEAITGGQTHGVMRRIADTILRKTGFTPVNKVNQYIAASTAIEWMQELHMVANGKNITGLQALGGMSAIKRAQRRLADFGIDYTKPLTEDATFKAVYRFATDTQLQKNVLRDPLFFNDPKLRPFVLFKRFGYRQTAFIWDEVVQKELIENGNPMPLLRLAAGGAVGGEFVTGAKRIISNILEQKPAFGYGDPGETADDLAGRYIATREEKAFLERIKTSLLAVGALGVMGDITEEAYETETLAAAKEKGMFILTPVMLQTIGRAFDIGNRIIVDMSRYESEDAARRSVKYITQMMGGLATRAGRGFETSGQKSDRLEAERARARAKFFNAYEDGDNEAGRRVQINWDREHPGYPLLRESIYRELIRHYKAEAKKAANP